MGFYKTGHNDYMWDGKCSIAEHCISGTYEKMNKFIAVLNKYNLKALDYIKS